ncbi:MAG: hypothetical protein WC596_01455 [Candidatus Shapirobacteria bacterium]
MTGSTFTNTNQLLINYLHRQRDNQKFSKSIELVATLFLIIFFVFVAIRPTFLTISSLVGEIKAKDQLVKKMKTKINNIIQAQENFSQVQPKYELIEASLPTRYRFFYAATQIQKNTNRSGASGTDELAFNLKSDSQTPTSLISDSNLTYFSTGLNVNGQLSSVADFVTKLLGNRRVLSIESITLGTKNKSSSADAQPVDGSNLNLNLETKLYYWQPSYEQK